jgi:hypothetical protein
VALHSQTQASNEEAKERKRVIKLTEAASAWIPSLVDGSCSSGSERDGSGSISVPGVASATGAASVTGAASETGVGSSDDGSVVEFDPGTLMQEVNPFQAWCEFLLGAIRSQQKVRVEVQLKGNSSDGHAQTVPAPARAPQQRVGVVDEGTVRFNDRNLHARMPLDPTHVRLKRTCV